MKTSPTFLRTQWFIHCLVLLLVSSISVAQADVITITNPGFEDISGESPFNEFTFGPLNGWDLYDPGGITQGGEGSTYFIGTLTPSAPTFFTNGAPEGQRVGIAFNFFGSGGQGEYGLQQTLAETLQPNTAYTLNVDIGNITSGTAVNGQFFNLEGFPGYRIDLLAGGALIAQDNNSMAGTIAEGQFSTSTVMFTTDSAPAQLGQALQIRLVNLNLVDPLFPNADLEVDFDNINLAALSSALVGDLNSDGFVGIADLNIVLGNWNQTVPPGDPLADPSGDGFVGIADLNVVLGNWNAGIPPTAEASALVPEPASLTAFWITGSLLLSRKRRPDISGFRV